MNDAWREVVDAARGEHDYRCPRCRYPLEGVRMDEDGGVVCPECGGAMRFDVVVRLVNQEDAQRRATRERMNRRDRVFVRAAVLALVLSSVVVVLVMVL